MAHQDAVYVQTYGPQCLQKDYSSNYKNFKADRQTHHENKVQFIKMFDITIHRLVINVNNF